MTALKCYFSIEYCVEGSDSYFGKILKREFGDSGHVDFVQ